MRSFKKNVKHLFRKCFKETSWQIERPAASVCHNTHRISARVAGHDVWFESKDVSLAPSVEGIASMFLVAALDLGATLRLQERVDPLWHRNAGELESIFRRWLAVPQKPALDCREISEKENVCQSGAVLFFTGGVDSFYSLLKGPVVEGILYVHGFDIALDDRTRMAQFEPHFQQIAKETGHRAVVIRTNLRQHPKFRKANWEMTHGGALAGVGHLIQTSFGRGVISSSDTGVFNVPWGSHQETDKLYSSGSFSVEHFGECVYRMDKLQAIAKEPLVRRHLHVCWENNSGEMNCCQCEKCLRAMVSLAGLGELEKYPVFSHGSGDLCARIDRLPIVAEHLQVYWVDSLQLSLPKDVEAAVCRLLGRSGWHP